MVIKTMKYKELKEVLDTYGLKCIKHNNLSVTEDNIHVFDLNMNYVGSVTLKNGYLYFNGSRLFKSSKCELSVVPEILAAFDEYYHDKEYPAFMYDPITTKQFLSTKYVDKYLESLGFVSSNRSHYGNKNLDSYALYDSDKTKILELTVSYECDLKHLDEFSGDILINIGTYSWYEMEFTDLNSCINSINSMISSNLITKLYNSFKVFESISDLSKIDHSGLKMKQFSTKTLSVTTLSGYKEKLKRILSEMLESLE